MDKEDRTLRKILIDFVASLFLVENKVYRSLKALLFAPARLPLCYIKGNTIRYVRPIQFFLLANLIYYLAPQIDTFNSNYKTQMHGLPYSAWIYPKVLSHLEEKGLEEVDFQRQFDRTTSQLAKLIVILLAPMMGFLLWALHAKKRQFYAGDHIAVALYILTFIILVLAVLLPIMLRLAHWLFSGLELTEQIFSGLVIVVITLYVTLAFRGVYQQRPWVATLKGLCFALFFIPFLHLFRFILLLATLGILFNS
ncbi:MAG: DUF3667 domain-containing protein [Bacteroidota bacterium]